ncbi:MAG: 3'-5' exonuclease [Chlorobium phaeobacteroides]|uniref:Exonuclease RNase T and DNA polymerase III n=1 Tax=Chlorobium phaeobacteroides (strain BS1) TaxID=331678 RepID=B3EKV8_CHLPB|nr:3'-5' exonuclease [Chlorobium phaeobacteroides]MBL6956598.1 3'-5' exonuclease [Chlorobium phaeobacteroides]
MSKKVLYIDVETTGTNPAKHGIIQIGAIMEVSGIIAEELNLKCAPHSGADIDDHALTITGTSREELTHRMSSKEALLQFKQFLNRYVEQYDREDKCYPAGYNVHFDLDFIQQWFKMHGDKYGIGSYVNWRRLDPLPVLFMKDFTGALHLPDYKLETVCRHYGIRLEAHDAFSDIRATRELLTKLL